MKPEVIKIPFEMPSRNDIDRINRYQKPKIVRQYQLFIRQQMSKYKIKEATMDDRFTLKVLAYRNNLIRDYTNLVGGFKLMEDALVHEGFIWDDSMKYIGQPEIGEKKTKGEPYTLIERRKK